MFSAPDSLTREFFFSLCSWPLLPEDDFWTFEEGPSPVVNWSFPQSHPIGKSLCFGTFFVPTVMVPPPMTEMARLEMLPCFFPKMPILPVTRNSYGLAYSSIPPSPLLGLHPFFTLEMHSFPSTLLILISQDVAFLDRFGLSALSSSVHHLSFQKKCSSQLPDFPGPFPPGVGVISFCAGS